MKQTKQWMVAAILLLCGSVAGLTSCDDDNDEISNNNGTEENSTAKTAAKAEVTYYVDLGANTLELADVEVTYLDEDGQSKSFMMTEKQWTKKYTLTATQLPKDYSLKVSFEEKTNVTVDSNREYEFGCVSRIPLTVWNSNGEKICELAGSVTVTDGTHPKLKGEQMSGWWLTYALGINPDKLANFDKKTLTVKSTRAVFNSMNYDYPYLND